MLGEHQVMNANFRVSCYLVAGPGEGRMCVKVITNGLCEACHQGVEGGETRFPRAEFRDRGFPGSHRARVECRVADKKTDPEHTREEKDVGCVHTHKKTFCG